MDPKRLKISFLIDSPDNWMVGHARKLMHEMQDKHDVLLIHDEKEIPNGDILFILSYYKLVAERYLKLSKNNIVVHASALPQGKGWSPATWQILENKEKIPLTLFEAVNKVDAGDIYFVEELELDGTELIQEWQNKMGEKIVGMVKKFIEQFPDNRGRPQSGVESFYPKRTPLDSQIDITKSIQEQFNQFRVANNDKYPVFFEYKGVKYTLKINKT